MQTSVNNQTKSSHLNSALSALRNAANKWDQAERNMQQVDRYLGSAEREFQNADSPARRASYDTANRDSSWEGRSLDRHFRNGDRQLDSSQWQMRDAKRNADGTGQDIDSGQSHLVLLEREYRQNNDPRLQSVQRAMAELNSSETKLDRVGNEWRRIDSSIGWTSNSVGRSDHDIRQIMWDRPGKDVSHHGFRVSNNLNSIQSDLRRIDMDLRRSGTTGDQAESHLDNAIRILEGMPPDS